MNLSLKVQPAQLVSHQDNEVTTTSLIIAEVFEKQHKNILKAIQNLDCSEDFASANFLAHVEIVQAGAVKRERKYYKISKDGFMFLAMGFTGQKAAVWKEAFINAFNQMQAELASQYNTNTRPDDWQRQLNAEKIRIAYKALSLGSGTYTQTLIGWMQRYFGSRTAYNIDASAEEVLYKLSDLVYRQRIEHLKEMNRMFREEGKPTFAITPPAYSGMGFTYNAQSALLQKEYPAYHEIMKEGIHPNQSITANQETPPKQTHLDGRIVSHIENGTVTHSRHLRDDEMIVSSDKLVTMVKQASLTQEQLIDLISHCSAQL